MFKRVFIVYDNDSRSHAGDKFTAKMAHKLLERRIPFVVGHVPDEYKDISEYYEAGGSLQQVVGNAINGLTYVCNTYTELDKLSDFLKPIVKAMKPARVEMLFSDLKDRSQFNATELKTLRKIVQSPPSEREVADTLLSERDIIYVEGAGFYEWAGRIWKRIPETIVRKYAEEAWGYFTTASRAKNVCDLVKFRMILRSVFIFRPCIPLSIFSQIRPALF